MNNEEEFKNAIVYGLKVVTLRPRSAEELKGKLKTKGFRDEIVTQVISEFTKKGILDDSKFSKLWLQVRMASNPKGEAALREELKEKGIGEETIDKRMHDLKEEFNEYEVVKALAESRTRSLKDLGAVARKRRLFGYLRRRGFAVDTIMRVIKEIGVDKGKEGK